jgi:hypothetical protein
MPRFFLRFRTVTGLHKRSNETGQHRWSKPMIYMSLGFFGNRNNPRAAETIWEMGNHLRGEP